MDERTTQLARLHAEIVQIRAQLEAVAAIPEAASALRERIAAREAQIAAIESGAPLPAAEADVSSPQQRTPSPLSAVSPIMTGPMILGPVTAGRDVNIGTVQTIYNQETPPPATRSPVLSGAGPAFRLWLEDRDGRELRRLAPHQEAWLRLGIEGDGTALPDGELVLEADADGVEWPEDTRRSLRFVAGVSPRPARWTLVPQRAGTLALRVLVLRGAALLQQLSLVAPCERTAGATQPDHAAYQATTVGWPLTALQRVKPVAQPGLTLTLSDDGRLAAIEDGRVTTGATTIGNTDLAEIVEVARSKLLQTVKTSASGIFTRQATDISKDDGAQAMRALAEQGNILWQRLFSSASMVDVAVRLREHGAREALSLTLLSERRLLPWQLIYDRDPAQPVELDGFWGLRHRLRVVPTRRGVPPLLSRPSNDAERPRALAGYYLPFVDEAKDVTIIDRQRVALANSGVPADEVTTEQEWLDRLRVGIDARLVYLFCHVDAKPPALQPAKTATPKQSPAGVLGTTLSFTRSGAVSLHDMLLVAPLDRAPLLRGSPLVILNACGSSVQSALTDFGLVPYLLDQGAQAVIGAECEAPVVFGGVFGPKLLELRLRDCLPLDEAMRAARRWFVEQHHNPLGLIYTLYGQMADDVLAV